MLKECTRNTVEGFHWFLASIIAFQQFPYPVSHEEVMGQV